MLLERESELGSIEAALAGAASGHGSVLVVEGAAGIGKSSLLAAAAERANGMRVLQARGAPLEQAYAFGTVRALFDPVRAASSAEWEALTADAAALARHALDPAPAAIGPGDDATHATLHGLFWLAANLCAERPLAAGRRRRALGRPAVAALARPPGAADRRAAAAGAARRAQRRAAERSAPARRPAERAVAAPATARAARRRRRSSARG